MAITGRTGIFSGRADNYSSGLAALPHEHLKIHEGRHFFYTENIGLDGSSVSLAIKAPTTQYVDCHMVFNVIGIGGFVVTLVEDNTYTDGSQGTFYNNDRNSATTPYTEIYTGVTPGGGGTTIWSQSISMGTAALEPTIYNLGTSRPEEEIILKTNKTYILTINSNEVLTVEEQATFPLKIDIYEYLKLQYGQIGPA